MKSKNVWNASKARQELKLDRLKTKALDAKCRVLVEQNEELMARLCELEMSHSGAAADESKSNRRLAEQDERIRQISSALESERDVSQRLREAKESLEKELTVKRKHDDAMSSRILMDAEMTKMEAQNKVDEMSVEVEAARKKVTEVMAEVEQLRAANFELQMHIETAKRTMEELADCNEDLEKQIEQIQEDCEEKEEDYKQSTWDVENLTRQNEALRVELDGVRQGFHETRELAEEVKMLKTELHRQQELHRAQFEAACEKLDSDDDVIERKTSLEIQQEQYILAYEQQIETLKKELELKNGPVAAPEEFSGVLLGEQTPVQRKTTAVLEAPRFEEFQMTSEDSEALRAEIAELRLKNSNFTEKIERLEMETKLSGELNVELGRAMLELEEHNELLRREQEAEKADEQGITKELELQELMIQEMTEQIATDSEELETLRAEQARLLKNLAESEIVRKEELETKNSEIQGFLVKIEELEAKLAEKERQETQETQILTSEPSESAPEALEAPESSEHQTLLHSVSHDMNKLIELKDELEIAVAALKSEIWTLNGQLKASILDREGLEDKVTLLDDLIEKEKKRAISLDAELQEQIDLTERAMRRAAEAENESNQRMAECLEKETRREEIEQAYTRLNEFYNQLQEAYNMIYAQLEVAKNSSESTTTSEFQQTTTSSVDSPDDAIVNSIMTILLISRDPSISQTTQQKMQKIAEKLKQLVGEFDENQKALEEQRQITQALEQRLQTIETASGAQNATTTRQRVEELEGEIEWKEEECEALKRRIRDLEKALEAVAERTEDESEAAAVSRLSTELAILAARLTTRQADVDSLFRTNAELAHTNVRLQNECDEWEEAREKMIEEKRELEQHVKELEEQVAELMEQHEAHLQQTQLLQSTTPILSPPTPNPETAAKLEESEREVIRLVAIEKTLNSRILALEDQNLELEEKFQEIEEEMMTVKAENAEKCAPTAQKSDWDDWGEQTEQTEPNEELREAKSEVERLLEVEKALTMRIESLQIHNEQLEQKMKELEGKIPSTSQPPPKQDDDWGWGDDDDTQETTIQTVQISKIDNSELEMAKADVARLSQIEKMLNERIEGLEEQNSDLEERLQAMEEDLMDVKREKTEKNETWDDWGDSEGVADSEVTSEDVVTILKKTIEELEEKCRFQKEVILKAEAQLVETQDKPKTVIFSPKTEFFMPKTSIFDPEDPIFRPKTVVFSSKTAIFSPKLYDELEETYQQSQLEKPSEELLRELRTQLELTRQEKQELVMSLEQMKIQKLEIDGRFDELRENEKKLKEEDEKELLKLRDSHQQLTARITHLESENSRIQAEMNQKIASIELEKSKVEEELNETLDELEDVKKKESESVTTSSGGWNDDGWGNDEETQKVLEMRVETLQDELQKFKEREAELSDESSELKSRLESAENEISNLQNEIQKTSGIQEELRRVTEQNGMLKDSEGRLMDQSDDFANRMEKYREECGRMAQKLTEMEEELRKEKMEKSEQKVMEKANEIVGVLRQQLAAANTEIHRHRHHLSAKEETIAELNRHISEHTKTIEELQGKLKLVRRAPTAPRSSVSHPSRPSSQMSSTSSRMSGATTTTSSVFVPEPIQSMGSAFDVVVPQTGEPLRRRNK
ncbi:hypothetical protein CRE_03317 [Caenorhabditis remanei]|uniref:Uncharacterized protein n=1 Tax=Caenorhabditis remanei TaxID=31234 RepID=E3MYK1_CAERE|nr:hypothetical protein CRE_03317 [Caenorhabditis remanei]